jgi:hypothetical protein
MRSSTIKALLALIVTVGLAICPAFAQTNTTGLSGTVTDAIGLKLSGAVITLMQTETGKITTLTSKAAGEYDFTQVVPGHYKVTVEHDGFSQEQIEIDLAVATPATLNFKLKVGSMQSVDVEAPAISTTLNQTDATLGKSFDNSQIEQLPYLANNTLSLLGLQPGVTALDPNSTSANAGTINGARNDQTNLTLDGTDNNDANTGTPFQGILRATRDSIEEFRVTTGGGNADSGRSSGAEVSLQTKSGTNHIHGSAYYYYRDPAMASNTWLNKQTELANTVNGVLAPKPNIASKVLQDTYGATVGLPIKKDKLFFFGAYEGFKQASNAAGSLTVPLGDGTQPGIGPGLRNGTLSYLQKGSSTAYTTLTSTQFAAMDQGCAANYVPGVSGCAKPGVDPNVIAFFNKYYPASNTTGGDNINTGGFSFVSPAPISQITNIARVDYNINSKQVMFVRANLQGDNQTAALIVPGGAPGSITYNNNKGITGGHIWTLSSSMNNNFRYGWTREGSAQRGAGSNYISFAGNTPGLPFPTGGSTILLQNTQNFVDDFTIVKGKHTIQLGGNDRLIYNHRLLTKSLYANATITANGLAAGGILGQNTSLDINNAITPYATQLGVPLANTSFRTSYNSAAANLAGLVTEATAYANYVVGNNALTAVSGVPPHEFRSFEQEYYVQDQWKVMPKLTFTVGLRAEHLGVPYEVNGQQVRPATSMSAYLANRIAAMNAGQGYNVLISTVPGGAANSAPAFWKGDSIDWAPRFAFNFAPDAKTSIRGGFQLVYDHFGQAAVDSFNDSYSYGATTSLNSPIGGTVDTVPRFTTETAVPQSLLPPAPAGGPFPITQVLGPGGITQTFDDSIKTPYAETFNLSVQRQLTKGLTLTTTYIGRLGRHQLELRDVFEPENLKDQASGETYFQAMQKLDKIYDAQVLAGLTPNTTAAIALVPSDPYWSNLFPSLACKNAANPTQAVYGQLARSNETATLFAIDVPQNLPSTCTNTGGIYNRYFATQYGSLAAQGAIGVSNYNALQFSVRHVVNRDIVYDFNYTFAHSMDEGSSPERSSGSNVIINTFNPSQMYANSTYDVRHGITADWVATLPYGHGQRFGGNSGKLMNELFGGWQLTGVLRYSSGFPWTSSYATSGWSTNWEYSSSDIQIGSARTSGHHTYYPGKNNAAGAPVGILGSAFGQGYPGNITAVSGFAGAAFRPAYVGESGQRDNLRADGYFSMDPGLSKTFPIREKVSFKLVVEYFNLTNAVRFSGPGSGSTTSTFGQYSGGTLTSPRQAQVAGRISF